LAVDISPLLKLPSTESEKQVALRTTADIALWHSPHRLLDEVMRMYVVTSGLALRYSALPMRYFYQ
jgi:hypothetical protein